MPTGTVDGLHQLGVGGLFTGEDDDRPGRLGEQRVQALLPGADAAEEAYDDEVDAVQQRGQVVEGEPGGVGVAVRTQAEDRRLSVHDARAATSASSASATAPSSSSPTSPG